MFDAEFVLTSSFPLFLLFLFSHTSLLFTLFSKSTDHPREVTWSQPLMSANSTGVPVWCSHDCRLITMLELLITKRRLKLILQIWVVHFVYFAVFSCFKCPLKVWTRRRLSASNTCPAGGARDRFKHRAQSAQWKRSEVSLTLFSVMRLSVSVNNNNVFDQSCSSTETAQSQRPRAGSPTVTPAHPTEDRRPTQTYVPSFVNPFGFHSIYFQFMSHLWLWFMSKHIFSLSLLYSLVGITGHLAGFVSGLIFLWHILLVLCELFIIF